ncbi:MAG TPA: ion channel [Propionibacteriaceae bacterium]|nr:ion channel [Propionibacteriaceae bacterium]
MERLRWWQRQTQWPLTVAAALFLLSFALPIIDTRLPAPWVRFFGVLAWATWSLFVVDYLVRIYLAPKRWEYVVRHWYDFVVLVLPVWHPFRLLRLAALLRVLNRNAAHTLRGKVATYVVLGSSFFGFCGALAVLQAERPDPNANIKSIGDALWWAIATMTTVGYGDRYPVTTTGRLVAVTLMIGGIAVLGLTTATVASWLVERVSARDENQLAALSKQVTSLQRQVSELSKLLRDESARR